MNTAGAANRPGTAQGLPSGSRCTSHQLPSGLWLLAAEVPTAHLVRLAGAVSIGYLDEPSDCRGLAHLLEHSLFLGSERWPAVDALSRWVAEQGGRYNAHTGETVTDIHLHLPIETADEGLARLCDLLMRPCFEPDLIAHEVGVLDAEFQARLADPGLHRLAAIGQLCQPQHPAALCHAGNIATLGSDPERLVARLRELHRHYRPERMALAMLGPQPLAEQLALLKRHAATLETGLEARTDNLAPRTWRWAEPAAVAWFPPQNREESDSPHPLAKRCASGISQLELLWPLPTNLAHHYQGYLAGVAARLNDGALAATLAQAVPLMDLEASLTSSGGGPGLALRLDLEAASPSLPVLLATVHRALAKAVASPLFTPHCFPDDSLDQWPRQQARRLAGQRGEQQYEQVPANLGTLTTWLAPDQGRLLWRPAPGDKEHRSWRTLGETGTRVKRVPLPALEAHRALPHSKAPLLTAPSARPGNFSRPSSRLITHWTQWRGEPRWPGSPDISHCALSWPAGQRGEQCLTTWRQQTLALGQAALSQGASLRLGSDALGSWLLAIGTADQALALAGQASAAWPGSLSSRAAVPSVGLIAQRLLNRLESAPPPGASTPSNSAPLSLFWTSSDLADSCHSVISNALDKRGWTQTDTTAASTDQAAQNECWLAPQATDHAVMLEVMANEASPRSRWLLRLLGQCHDAAFQHALRQRQGLGYAAAVRYREAAGWPRLGYVVQSPTTDSATLRHAIEDFLATQAISLSHLTDNTLDSQRRGLLARHGPPETYPEALLQVWQRLRQQPTGSHASAAGIPPAAWLSPWQEEAATLAHLTPNDLDTATDTLVSGGLPRRWWYHHPG